jgi:hypothetical protein
LGQKDSSSDSLHKDESDDDDRSVYSDYDTRKSTIFRDDYDNSVPEFSLTGSFSKRRTRKLLTCMSSYIDDIKTTESRRIPSKLDQFVMTEKPSQELTLTFSSDMAQKREKPTKNIYSTE